MRYLSWLALVLVAAASAQQPPPTFQTGTTLIEFTLVALDDKGNPVTDLQNEDIEITNRGRPREVAFFRFEGTSESREAAQLAPGEFTNRAEYTTGPPRNITAIVIDTLNTRLEDQVYLRYLALRYLQEISPDTRIAIYRIGRGIVQSLHDFTDDVEPLRDALSQSFLRAPMQNDGMGQTLASLEWIGDRLAGIPGRKSMVWITGGVSDPAMLLKDWDDHVRGLARRLASQGITVYPVDAVGLEGMVDVSLPISWRSARGGVVLRDLSFGLQSRLRGRVWAVMDILASTTGGRTTRESNDLTRGIEQASADVRGSYTVGFYVDDAPDDKWYRLNVKTSRKGVNLTHRKGYLLSTPSEQPQTWSAEEWMRQIVNPLGSTEIHLDGRCEPADEDGIYGLVLQIAVDDLGFVQVAKHSQADLDVAVAEKTAVGDFSYRLHYVTVQLTGSQEAPAGTFAREELEFQLEPDTVTIRVIVRDRLTGRHGTLDLPVNRLPGQPQ